MSELFIYISSAISLAGVIYIIGYWKGHIDTCMKQVKQCLHDYSPAETSLMVKTLWNIYVIEALHSRPDLASHSSHFKLNKVGEDLIPEALKQQLNHIHSSLPIDRESLATGYLVVKHIGLELITVMAEEKHLSVQESVAILSTYLEMKLNSNHPAS